MPLLDSFMVDHTKMKAPAVRIAKKMSTKSGDPITVYDLRFYQPNVDMMSDKGIHTLEHLFAGFMRDHLNSNETEIIDVSPMGCKTGFYMSVAGTPSEEEVQNAWSKSMDDVLEVPTQNDIPELNKFQCGTFAMHSLEEAKKIATDIKSSGVGIMNNKDIEFTEAELEKLLEEGK